MSPFVLQQNIKPKAEIGEGRKRRGRTCTPAIRMRISTQLFSDPATLSCSPLPQSSESYRIAPVSSPAPRFAHPLSCFSRFTAAR